MVHFTINKTNGAKLTVHFIKHKWYTLPDKINGTLYQTLYQKSTNGTLYKTKLMVHFTKQN